MISPLSVFPYWAISIDMLVPRGQLNAMYSASQPAFWYVLSVPASNAVNKQKEKIVFRNTDDEKNIKLHVYRYLVKLYSFKEINVRAEKNQQPDQTFRQKMRFIHWSELRPFWIKKICVRWRLSIQLTIWQNRF